MKALAVEQIGVIALVILFVAVGSQIMSGILSDSDSEPNIQKIYPKVQYDYCARFKTDEAVGKEQIKRLIYYRLSGNCNVLEQHVTTSEPIPFEELSDIAADVGLVDSDGTPLILFESQCQAAKDNNVRALSLDVSRPDFPLQPEQNILVGGGTGGVYLCDAG